MRKYISLLLVILSTVSACSIKTGPIVYGTDACHFCSMTIVDQQHAAQIVTKKGRHYNFDAPECMMNHLKTVEMSDIGLFMVNDYDKPGKLIDATKATFLISKGIPSPMGAFLTAFRSKNGAEKVISVSGGELYTWEELKTRFKN